MAVSKEITRLEKSNVKLSITVPKDDVRVHYQDMLKEYTKTLQLPGFRKGKVPQQVLERKFAEHLKGDALGRIIESVLQDYFKDENLPRNERPLPYATPELQDEPKFELDQDLKFSVVYDVLPEIKIGQKKGLQIEYPYTEITDDVLNVELDQIRDRNAVVMDKDDGAAATGDVVTIDYSILDEKGETLEGMERKDFAFTIGSGTNFYQFDDDITGMKKGETKEFEKTFPGDFFEPTLAGQSKKIRVSLTSLKEKKLPELDDDLAQDVDEKFKTLDDLKSSIKEKMNRNIEYRLREKKTNELLKVMMENTPVILPESMIKAEVESRIRRLAKYYNTNAESLMQMMAAGEGSEERMKEWRETASKSLHSRLIIETLMEEQNIEVTDTDIEKEFERIAGESSTTVDEVKKHYDEQAMFYLKEDLKEKQVIDLLFAENTLKPGKKENYLDFISGNE